MKNTKILNFNWVGFPRGSHGLLSQNTLLVLFAYFQKYPVMSSFGGYKKARELQNIDHFLNYSEAKRSKKITCNILQIDVFQPTFPHHI